MPRRRSRRTSGPVASLPGSGAWLRLRPWLLVAGPGLVLLLLDWQLTSSLAAGAGAMLALGQLQSRRGQHWLERLRRQLQGTQGRFLSTAAVGGAAMVSVYLAGGIWLEEGQPWTATALLLESFGLIALLALLLRSPESRDRSLDFDDLLARLGQSRSLDRWLALRQLQQQRQAGLLAPAQVQLGDEAVRLLLQDETDSRVREAALEWLQPSLGLAAAREDLPTATPLRLPPRRTAAERRSG